MQSKQAQHSNYSKWRCVPLASPRRRLAIRNKLAGEDTPLLICKAKGGEPPDGSAV